MQRYLQSTREKIIKSQEPVKLDRKSQKKVDLQFALLLSKSTSPKLKKRGKAMLKRIQNRRVRDIVRRLPRTELDASDAELLANRRTWFIQRIEENENV